MEQLRSFKDANKKVLVDTQNLLMSINTLSSSTCTTSEAGIRVLDRPRKNIYENLNQIQHEHLVVRAAEWLLTQERSLSETIWFWNPRQTGNNSEPDLRGCHNGAIVISAEITTSERPVGAIAKRMQNTLEKLSIMQGSKFYFVRTLEMQTRANCKIAKAGWEIEVVKLAVESDALG